MQAVELTAEFGIAGVLDFVETEHGLIQGVRFTDGIEVATNPASSQSQTAAA